MDIIILFLLLFTAIAIWRAASPWLVVSCWVVSLVLMLGLFDHHVTSSLGLSY